MYGFFNHAFEMFIISTYGKDHWEIIRDIGGIFHEHFDAEIVYDDNMIYELIDAACDHLDIDVQELQEKFGEMYFDHCLASNHGQFLDKLGGNLFDFLSNIDALHDYLNGCYAGVKIPSFRVRREVDSSMYVTYFSDRDDLEFIIPGIIRQAAKRLFKLDVEVIYDMMPYKTTRVYTKNPEDACLMFPKEPLFPRSLIPHSNEPKVSPTEFAKSFPFHIIFDDDMTIVQLGAALQRILLQNSSSKNEKVTSLFLMTRPQISFDFESIKLRLNNMFVLTTQNKPSSSNNLGKRSDLRLKGQMIHIEKNQMMLFLCSPNITCIEDMQSTGLCLSDIPIHDATRDLVLLSENIQKELKLTQQLGIVSDHLKTIHMELEEQLLLYNRLLYAVLPATIAKRLGEGQQVLPERYQYVTLMFSGIVDFSSICHIHDSKVIVHMLNELYIKFDDLILLMNECQEWVYKVETIGDKYMTASGVPDKTKNNPTIICNLALDMHDEAKEIIVDGKPIQVTFGIHSGEIVAGVIGQKMPRYCLFGNSVNLASRTETTGIPGKINVTEDTYKLIDFNDTESPDQEKIKNFLFTERGKVKMKGKSEPMTTYTLERRRSRAIPLHTKYVRDQNNDILASPGNTQEYFSFYKKPKRAQNNNRGYWRLKLGNFSSGSSKAQSQYSTWYSSTFGSGGGSSELQSSFHGSAFDNEKYPVSVSILGEADSENGSRHGSEKSEATLNPSQQLSEVNKDLETILSSRFKKM